jgi:peptidyl-prolyl cis-trans isomerase A (cyclophilin A)
MKMYILGASICNLPTPTSTMAKLYSLLLCAFFFVIIGTRHVEAQKVLIETDHGSIMIELYPDSAAITVANFLKYVDGGLFNATKFYRVVRMDNQPNSTIKIEVIQGGMGNDSLKRLLHIVHETTKNSGIKHLDGTLSMARTVPGSASSEFFICINDQPELDFGGLRNPDGQGFAAFGRVIQGMDVVRQIQLGETGINENVQTLIKPVKIISVKRL